MATLDARPAGRAGSAPARRRVTAASGVELASSSRRRSRSTSSSSSSRSSGGLLQPLRLERARPLTDFIGLDNYREAFDDPASGGAEAQRDPRRALDRAAAPARARLALLLNRRLRGRSAPAADLLRAVRALRGDHRGRSSSSAPARRRRRPSQRSASAASSSSGSPTSGIVLYTLFVVITWKYIGFAIILFLAGLQGIPPSCTRRPRSTARRAGRRSATSRCRCSGRRSGSGFPVDHRLAAALRHRLDHDRSADRRTRRRRWPRT